MRQASFFLTACAGHGSRPSVSLCSTRCATGVALEYPFGRASDDALGSQVKVPAFCGGHTMAVEVSGGGLLPTVQQFCSVVGSYHCAEDLWR